MKKIAIVVAMFMLASPVWAVVDVNIIPVPFGTTGDVNITYAADANISGFGLDITVDSGANITAINNFHIGESNSTATGFGIFPGSIDINDTTGDVDDYGTPVAPNTDPCALGGIGTAGITVEMGALYEDGYQPGLTGTLCTVTVSADCNITVALNARRGGVVKEDFNDATTNLPITVPVTVVSLCTVPNVVGSTEADANTAIDGAGLDANVSYAHDCSVTAGNVISQDPSGGAEITCGLLVDIVVADGNTDVPNVEGQAEATATANITAAGLSANVSYAHDCSVTAGNVISQSPSGGAEVSCASTVDISVADGNSTVPDVEGQTEATATANITAAGLSANVSYAHDCSVTAGNVISQNPAGTTEVSCASTVDISVADGNVIVPNLLGMTQADANAAIIAVGLAVGTIDWDTSWTVDVNLVMAQDPNAYAEVSCNPSTVSYTKSSGCYPKALGGYGTWISVGKPNCWCYNYHCKGDTDGLFDGKDVYGKRQYVVLPDLWTFAAGWQKFDNDPNFSTFICADFDTLFDGKNVYGKRQYVVLPDLWIFAAGWQKYDNDPCMVNNPCFP